MKKTGFLHGNFLCGLAGLVLMCALFLTSCELSYSAPEKGTLRVLAYGNDFLGYNGSKKSYVEVKELGGGFFLDYLTSPVNDASNILLAFKGLAEQADMDFESINLASNSAYKSDFTAGLETLASEAKSSDISVIYISTHGYNAYSSKTDYGNDTASTGFFVLDKAQSFTEIMIKNYVVYKKVDYMMADDFLAYVENIPGTVLVLADFCESGSLVKQDNMTVNRTNYSGVFPFSLLLNGSSVNESSTHFFLTSSSYTSDSYVLNSISPPLSVFTKVLLEGLGWNVSAGKLSGSIPAAVNGYVTLDGLYNYIYKNGGIYPADSKIQVPQVSGGSNDLVLFKL